MKIRSFKGNTGIIRYPISTIFFFFWCVNVAASNARMIAELWIGNDLDGSGRSLIEVLFRNYSGGAE